jgi:cellulose synthase (UDP-forming)
MEKPKLNIGYVSPLLLTLNMLVGCVYFTWWLDPAHIGNRVLFSFLILGEIYHLFMAFTFWYTIRPVANPFLAMLPGTDGKPTVDVFITVAGEPVEVVKNTIISAKNMDYPNFKIHVLNDGFVAKKDNWREIESLAKELNVDCITRVTAGGAKAGNINHALKATDGELITIFDADMAPHDDFLRKTVPYFSDKKTGFVQTPQFYKNYEENAVSLGAWNQQEIFFGPIMKGKDHDNSAFLCGTNVVLRRKALESAGGMYQGSIAEDILTSLFIHQKGWTSKYIPEILAEGLAPEDLLSYYKQQFRWARGSMDILFKHNPIFKKGLTTSQKIQYLSSALYYFNGLIVLIDLMMPILFLFFNVQAVVSSTTSFAVFFIPFMILNLFTLYSASEASLSFKALGFSYSSWFLQLSAIKSALLHEKVSFSVTPKQAQSGNFIFLVYPHLFYITLTALGYMVGFAREGLSPAMITNVSWSLFNISMFIPFIEASYNNYAKEPVLAVS